MSVIVVVCLDEEYLNPACAMLKSLVRSSRLSAPAARVYAVDCTKDFALDVSGISEACSPWSVTKIARGNGPNILDRSSPAFARCELPWLFPSVPRVIYLDCDLLVRHCISELWETDLQGHALAAAVDVGQPSGSETLHSRDWSGQRCFNTGVMIMDLEALRSRYNALLTRSVSGLTLLDQDLLNLIVGDDWLEISLRWNAQGLGSYAHFRKRADASHPSLFTKAELATLERDPYIVHFTGPLYPPPHIVLNPYTPTACKPWGFPGQHPFADKFRALLPSPAVFDAEAVADVCHRDVEALLQLLDCNDDRLALRSALTRRMNRLDTRAGPSITSSVPTLGCIRAREYPSSTLDSLSKRPSHAFPKWEGECVLITGAAGFLGRAISAAVLDRGAAVVAVDDLRRGRCEWLDLRAQFALGDCADARFLTSLLTNYQPRIVIHCAAHVGSCASVFGDEARVLASTLSVDAALVTALLGLGSALRDIHVMYIGSACAYPANSQASLHQNSGPLSPAVLGLAAPESGYGWAKLTGELLFASLDSNVKVAELHNLYGRGCALGDDSQVVGALCARALAAEGRLPVWGSGCQYRDFTHVTDAVAGILRLAGSSSVARAQFGAGRGTMIREVASNIALRYDLTLSFDQSMPEGDTGRVADLRAASLLKWRPQRTLSDGPRDTMEWAESQWRGGSSTLALCLPITSKGVDDPMASLHTLAPSLPWECKVYLAVDDDDPVLSHVSEPGFAKTLGRSVSVSLFPADGPPPLYHWYNVLCRKALDEGAERTLSSGG